MSSWVNPLPPEERIEHYDCPEDVAKWLLLAGGENRYGEPKFRCVWGFNRIVPIHGLWEEWEETEVPDLHPMARPGAMRKQIYLKRSVVETRQAPKYLPGNCWHLEMWRPPEECGSPEAWTLAGREIYGLQTVDTAGEYPTRGEYEIVFPLTDTLTYQGNPMPLSTDVVAMVVEKIRQMIYGKENFTMQQRKAAIEQEAAKKDRDFTNVTVDRLKDGLRPFCGETFVTVPGSKLVLPA